jgi:hypothetical protein
MPANLTRSPDWQEIVSPSIGTGAMQMRVARIIISGNA